MLNIRIRKINFHLLGCALANCLALIFIFKWITSNTQLPTSDAATFLSTITVLYGKFVKHGVVQGILSCYLDRGWRPILFPVSAIPFMLISHGNLLFAVNCIAIFSVITSATYVYHFFKLQLNTFNALLATNSICLLPFIQAQITGFYAESLLFPCVIGSVFHLIKSDCFTNLKHSLAFALLFSLAMMLRPIETIMEMILVLILFLAIGVYRNIFSIREIIIVIALTCTTISAFFVIGILQNSSLLLMRVSDYHMVKMFTHLMWITLFTSIILWLFINYKPILNCFKIKSTDRVLLVPIFSAICLLTWLWFAPFSLETFEWIYRTSFGDVAAGTTKLEGITPNIWHELLIQITAEGLFVVAGAALFAVINTFIRFICRNQHDNILPCICLLLMVPIPLLEVIFTVQDIHRKLSIAFPALLMMFLWISLKPGYLSKLRSGTMGVFVGIQYVLLMNATFYSPVYNPILDKLIGYYAGKPVTQNPNAHNSLLSFLNTAAKNYKLKSIALAVNSNTIEPVDPFLMSALVQASNNNYEAKYLYLDKFTDKRVNNLTYRFNAIVVSDRIERMQVNGRAAKEYKDQFDHEKSPSLKIMYQLLYAYSNGKLENLGWRLGPCTVIQANTAKDPIKDSSHARCLTCLLLPLETKE